MLSFARRQLTYAEIVVDLVHGKGGVFDELYHKVVAVLNPLEPTSRTTAHPRNLFAQKKATFGRHLHLVLNHLVMVHNQLVALGQNQRFFVEDFDFLAGMHVEKGLFVIAIAEDGEEGGEDGGRF